ncbi:alpha-mannosidase, partial [Lusitaniella coriacea LEGE 07157]
PVPPSIPCSKRLAISSQIETAWKKILFNQFHDILPGTSIPEVFVTANRDWEEAIIIGTEIVEEALCAIARHITLPSPPHPNAQPLLIFNPLNWTRSEVVELPHSNKNWTIYTAEGQPLPIQLTRETLLFLATDIPSIGYRLFWLCESSITTSPRLRVTPSPNSPYILENPTLRVTINPQTGDISSLFDKINQREILNGAGNQLQAFKDEGQYWDAWNIDPNYQKHPLPPTQLKSIEWLEQGAIRQRLRVIRQLNNSQFTQDYILDTHSPLLNISTTADWQERHVLLKAAFPLNLEADFATYETACGAIERTTNPKTPAEKAKWEVPALQWADLTIENEYGVSILNDCKYGYDAQPNQLRLTLLRGSMWPHPDADRGEHYFSYAIYPHNDSWKTAQTVRKGYEFNQSLNVIFGNSQEGTSNFFALIPQPLLPSLAEGESQNSRSPSPRIGMLPSQESEAVPILPPVASLLDLSAENLILTAFKPTENDPKTYILRCYECHGKPAELSLNNELQLNLKHSVNLLEQPLLQQENDVKNRFDLIQPWKVASFIISKT